MSQVLSQDEIDALLGGLDEVTEPEPETEQIEPSHKPEDVVVYDFANAAQTARLKFPAFDAINDRVNRGIRSTMSSILRIMVESSVVPTKISLFDEFLRRVPVPSSLHILKMDPFRGHVMMLVDSQLVFSIVEIFLGSTKIGQTRVEGREFTSIEQRLIRRIVNAFFSDLEKAWQPIQPIKINYVRSEINPQFAKIAQNEDAVLISKFQLDMEEVSGDISLCIPLNVLHPIKKKLQSTFQGDEMKDPAWSNKLVRNLKGTELEVKIPLGTANITGAELLDLSVGDIIQLDTGVDHLLSAIIQGHSKFYGRPGTYKAQRAFRVEEVKAVLCEDEGFSAETV